MEININQIKKLIEHNKDNAECIRGVFLTLNLVKSNKQESELKELRKITRDMLLNLNVKEENL